MRKLLDDECRKIEIQLLDDFVLFCEKNNLRYFLAYGTLIGSIRHHGFIPWDDDIDIMMPREDYNKAIMQYNLIQDSPYRIIDPMSSIARHSFAKVVDTRTIKIERGLDYRNGYLGVDIDIFPIDGQPESYDNFKKWKRKLLKYYRRHYYYNLDLQHEGVKEKIKLMLLRSMWGNKDKQLALAKALHDKYTFDESDYVGVLESIFVDEGDRVKKCCYEGYILSEFEGKEYRIPQGYDNILHSIYGNYMELPPIEKRVKHHTNECYWIES